MAREALDALAAALEAHPALRYASAAPGLEFVAGSEATAPGLYDRHAPLERTAGAPWTLRPGDNVSVVFLDDYVSAPLLAAGGRPAEPGDFGASMAGFVAAGDDVSPQHYILRLTVASGAPSAGAADLLCCCLPVDAAVAWNETAPDSRAMAASRLFAPALTAAGQRRARLATETIAAALRREAQQKQRGAGDAPPPRRPPADAAARDVLFLRFPDGAAAAELWRQRGGDCEYQFHTTNCG